MLDTEHGAFNPESVERMVRAADARRAFPRSSACRTARPPPTPAALSTPARPARSSRAPTESPPVRAAVESVKYAPTGKRGLAGVRANRYGTVPFDHWVLEANEATAVVIQIETAGALNAVSEIAAEKWVDLLFVGPNDLSQALGVPGHYDDPRYVAAVERVAAVAREPARRRASCCAPREQIPALADAGLHGLHDQRPRRSSCSPPRAWRAALAQD